MSLFLIILAAGDSKRLNSSTPKPYHLVNNKTLLEYSLNAFRDIKKIKKTIIVYNSKHKKYLKNLFVKNVLKITGGKTRHESTFKALKASKIGSYKTYGDCSLAVDYDSKSFVPLQEVTDSLVADWVVKELGEKRLKAIETVLSARIKSEATQPIKKEKKND